jgi:hypothetical protein
MPSLFNTSRTSPDPECSERFLVRVLDRVCVSLRLSIPVFDGACSRVETEGGLASAGFDNDILLRPSSASLRSVTPTLLADLDKLCREMFSMCIRAGEILRRGEMPSPRTVFSYADDFSTAIHSSGY